jgi:uncharacterized protein (TIGR02594 family)
MLPSRYGWLAREPGPKMLIEALKLFGTLEAPGAKNNPVIVAWAKEVGGEVGDVYKADAIPWCGLFMAVVARRAGKEPPKHPLWALSWSAFGTHVDRPMLGDVLAFARSGGGHVTLYVGEDGEAYHCLGGNQSDTVCITRIAKGRLYAARRPLYRVQPDNVRVVHLAASGELSRDEA